MPTMRLLTCFLQLLAGLALPAVSPQPPALSAGNNSSQTKVMPFQVVWGRSYCRAMEKLVDVLSEYPQETQYMFSPSCVPLLRCTGCCGDEALHCVPVETTNVTMQILRISSEHRSSYVEMTFSQHTHCACRLTNGDTFLLTSGPTATAPQAEPGPAWPVSQITKPERRRPKGSGKRKKEKQRPTD